MKDNKTTYELQIGGNIHDLKEALSDAKKALRGLDDSSFASGFDKKMSSVLSQLDRLKKKASRPIGSKATFTSLENGFSDIVEDAKGLLEELTKISKMTTREKLSLLPEGEAKKYKEALNAVSAYDRAVEKAEKSRIRQQEKRKADKSKTSEDLETAKVKHESAKKKYTDATAKGSKYGDAKAIVDQAEAAKKAQREIDSLEKQLKKYQKRLEELNAIEADKRTPEQESELATVRSNIKSVGGKIGARKKVVNKGPDEKTLTAAEKTVEAELPKIQALEEAADKAEKEVTRLQTALDKLEEAIASNNSEIKNSQADYRMLYAEAKKLGVSLDGVTEDVSSENVRILQTRMRELAEQGVKPLDDAIEQLTPEFQKMENAARDAGDGVKQGLEKFSDKAENDARINNLKENIRQFIGWAGASKVLGAALRNAFQDIKELDKAMTEIAVVTDFDIGDMWDQMPQYTERANDLGLAITEVYEASALFYQQGLDTNEMMALSNETLKMAKIAGLDAAEATDRMTAALRGFNMELDEASAQKVADVYSELAAITASDVDEISSAMTKTASIASSAGMEFETTAAFLSQIIETTRESAETAGTAMKTVIARFQELKKSPDEIGEIDGEIVDANAIEGALRSVGVSLRDAGGQFRELDDVFLELSSKWDGLDKNTQRYIATIAAGSRQQSRFIAMMQDYERTQELVTAANNSAGASQKQYEKTLESIDTKLKQLDNAWTEFSTGLMNSDIVKFAVDFLTSLLNALNRVTEGFGGLTGSLSKIGTMIAIFQTAKSVINTFFDELLVNIHTSAVKIGESIGKGVKQGLDNEGGADGVTEGPQKQKKLGAIGSMKQGLGKLKEAKNKKEQAKFAEQYYAEQVVEVEKYWGKDSDEAKAAIEELTAAQEERILVEKEADKLSSEGFKSIAQGAQVAAQAITMVGAGLGMVGQMFKQAGMEEVGEGFQMVGNAIAFIGSALMAIVPVISLLGTTFTVAGEQISLAGLMAQAGWWPLLLIGLAIAAVVTTIILVANAIKKASPEYKLEQAQKAADKAADAADRAAESYENLVNTFEGLEQGYDTLKNLTRGTEEWNEAVKNINDSVLDLIAEYPELAKFVDNEGGVLTIDMDDANVQQVLKDAETSTVVAKNSATLANLSVVKAEDDLAYKNLDDDAKFNLGGANAAYGGAMAGTVGAGAAIGALVGTVVPVIGNAVGAAVGAGVGAIGGLIGGFFTGEAAKDAALEDTQNTTEALAKAIADGAIIDNGSEYDVKDAEKLAKYGLNAEDLSNYYAQVGDSTEALREFGEQLLQTSAQEQTAFAAIATSAYQLANTLGMTEEEQVQASNIVDDTSVKKMYEDNMKELEGTDFTDEKAMEGNNDLRKKRDEAIRAQYGADARIEGNKVTYRDAEGKQQTEELTNDELKAMIANNITTQETKSTIEMAPQTIDYVIGKMGYKEGSAGAKAIEAATKDQEGGNLTAEEAKTLAGMDEEKLRKVYQGMSEEQKNVFGSEDEYIKKIKGAGEIAAGAFENASKGAEKIGLTLSEQGETVAEKFANTFGFMTSDMAKGFVSKMEVVWNATGEEGVKQIQNTFDSLLDGKDDATKQAITARMNALDWTNAEQLLAFEIELEEQYGYTREEAQGMTKAMAEGAKATSNLTTTVEIFGDFYHATERLNAALKKTSDLQWEYERMLKNGAKATELATNLEEQRQSILDSGYQALAAYEAARNDQATVYAKGVNLAGVNKDVTQYVKFDESTGTYDLTELQRQINAGEFGAEGTESRKAVEDYISELKEANELAEDQIDAAKEAYEQLEDLNEQAEEAYWSLYETIEDAILEELESQIALQESLLDATETANEKIIDKLQEQIDSDRMARENEKQEEEIKDLQTRAAYLGMDTSGANTLELLDLEKQIAEQEQDYQEKLVDQSLQLLQDANEKAADQRREQIDLARAQLEIYKNSPAFQDSIKNTLSEFLQQLQSGIDVRETTLGTTLMGQEFYNKMHPGEQATFWAGLTSEGGLAQYFIKTATNTDGTDGDSLATILSAINTSINNAAAETNLSGNYSAAHEKAQLIKSKTGFEYTLPEFHSYYNADGSLNADSAKTDIVNTNNAYTTVDKLQTRNSEGTTKYTSYEASEKLFGDKMLSESDFYDAINRGDTVTAGEKEYTSEHLQSSLNNQSTDGDYKDYVDTFVSSRYGEKSQLEYVEDEFTNAMANTTPARLSGEVAFRGWETIAERHSDLISAYTSAGGSIDTLKDIFINSVYSDGISGAVNLAEANANDWLSDDWLDKYKRFSAYITGYDGTKYGFVSGDWDPGAQASSQQVSEIESIVGNQPADDWATMVNGSLFVYKDGAWRELVKNLYLSEYSNKLKGRTYKTGGLADFTGPAWLDGTPSKPEYILNAAQTERFFSLVDVLEGYDTNSQKTPGGDNYFEIEINVEKIEEDYDVEQIANKIRSMIYEDATYRNVNAINQIH